MQSDGEGAEGADVLTQRRAQVVFVACFRDHLPFIRLPDFAMRFGPGELHVFSRSACFALLRICGR